MPTADEGNEIWSNCAHIIRSKLSEAVWNTTFRGARVSAYDQSALVIAVPTSLQKARIERRYVDMIAEAVDDTTDSPLDVRIEIDSNWRQPERDPTPPRSTSRQTPDPKDLEGLRRRTNQRGTDRRSSTANSGLNATSRLTFEQFVTASSNQFAHATARAVAEAPGNAYNPLFIYGAAGLGKTHLLHSIGHYVDTHFHHKKVCYTTLEKFLNEFVSAIRNNTQPEFKRRYRTNDVLLVDDMQFMEDKEGLQEEFFHTFNDLIQGGKQIVMSSDRPPDQIPSLENRMRSRFKSGLLADIQPPDLVTRLAILNKKAEYENVTIPASVMTFIAENITDSIRELEGALTKITAYTSLIGRPCTLERAKGLLADLITPHARPTVTVRKILQKASEISGIPVDQIVGTSRRRPIVEVRQIAMYVTRNETDLSFPKIGEAFGNRDHTTVIHGVKKIEQLIVDDVEMRNKVQTLRDSVVART